MVGWATTDWTTIAVCENYMVSAACECTITLGKLEKTGKELKTHRLHSINTAKNYRLLRHYKATYI